MTLGAVVTTLLGLIINYSNGYLRCQCAKLIHIKPNGPEFIGIFLNIKTISTLKSCYFCDLFCITALVYWTNVKNSNEQA